MLSIVDNPVPNSIRQFLAEMERLDPLTIPGDWLLSGFARVCAVVSETDEIMAMAWLVPRLGVIEIDIRVKPKHRRASLGARLFEYLAPKAEPLVAACDAAHEGARRFLECRGFVVSGVAFEQRWDGDLSDVPRAFETARISEVREREQAWEIFRQGMMDSWPPAPFDRGRFQSSETRVQVASVGREPVGVLASRLSHGTSNIGGIGVLSSARNHGVGRALLCTEMAWAARARYGVSMQVGTENYRVLEWTRNLGFWSARTRTYYERASKPARGRSTASFPSPE